MRMMRMSLSREWLVAVPQDKAPVCPKKFSGLAKFGLNQRPANDRRGKSINVEKNLPHSTCRWLEMRKQGETGKNRKYRRKTFCWLEMH